MLRRPVELKLGAVVGVDDRAATGVALLDRHPERVARQPCGGVVADRPADDAAAERVEHDRAVDLALPRGVLGDVGQPELVWPLAPKDAVDEVLGGRTGHAPPFARTVAAGDSGALHQHRNRVVADPDPAPEHELGMDTIGAVAAVRGGVDLADQIGQPRVPNRPR